MIRSFGRPNSSNEAIADSIGLFKGAGIYVSCDNILGLPNEGVKDLEDISYFYDRHLPDHIEVFWLRYYPKAEIVSWATENNYIDHNKIEEIEEGRLSCGIVRGGDHNSKIARKFSLLFCFFHALPAKWRRYILNKRLYRFLPSFFSPVSLYIMERVFNHSKYDLNISRTISRYAYFVRLFFTPRMRYARNGRK
ncbi:MAG: hypothetical protein PHU91_03920 [Candidatus Omnitrophica bacterium]|nr:hypothetical protein [Candidatus Omnitrophota bacterium]